MGDKLTSAATPVVVVADVSPRTHGSATVRLNGAIEIGAKRTRQGQNPGPLQAGQFVAFAFHPHFRSG
jgi:hypothetical protein